MSKKHRRKPTLSLFKWGYGRQNTGYRAFTLLYSKWLKLDCYLIHYAKGTYIPEHKDPVKKGHRHYRLNIELWKAKKGGEFYCSNNLFQLGKRLFFFRPDIESHSVTPVEEGSRWVFSIGKTVE